LHVSNIIIVSILKNLWSVSRKLTKMTTLHHFFSKIGSNLKLKKTRRPIWHFWTKWGTERVIKPKYKLKIISYIIIHKSSLSITVHLRYYFCNDVFRHNFILKMHLGQMKEKKWYLNRLRLWLLNDVGLLDIVRT